MLCEETAEKEVIVRSLAGPFGFLRGNILVLTASGSLGMFSRAMVFPYVPLYVLALGGEPEQIGIVYALGPLGGLLAFPIAGYLADHMNRAWLIAAAGYFSAVAVLINAVAPSWEWVAAAMLIRGFAVFHFPASSALVADSLPVGNRGRGMATMTALTGGLALFAPFVAGVAIDAWGVEEGMRILYWVMGAAYAAGATINLIFIRETRKPSAEAISAANLGQTLRRSYYRHPGTAARVPAFAAGRVGGDHPVFYRQWLGQPLLGGVRQDPHRADGFAVGTDSASGVRSAEPDDDSGGISHGPLWTHAVYRRRAAGHRGDAAVSAGWLLWVRTGDSVRHRRGRCLFQPGDGCSTGRHRAQRHSRPRDGRHRSRIRVGRQFLRRDGRPWDWVPDYAAADGSRSFWRSALCLEPGDPISLCIWPDLGVSVAVRDPKMAEE